jgi:hypothetical protein
MESIAQNSLKVKARAKGETRGVRRPKLSRRPRSRRARLSLSSLKTSDDSGRLRLRRLRAA